MAWLNDHPPAGRHRYRDPGSRSLSPAVPIYVDRPTIRRATRDRLRRPPARGHGRGCELHYADDPDVEIIDSGIHDTDSLHGHKHTAEEMSVLSDAGLFRSTGPAAREVRCRLPERQGQGSRSLWR